MILDVDALDWGELAGASDIRAAVCRLSEPPLRAAQAQWRDAVLSARLRGQETARQRAAAIQKLLHHVAAELARHYQIAPEASQFTLVAQGGFGRGELGAGSDLDLLFFCNRPEPKITAFIETLLYSLWDLQFKVGHAVHDLKSYTRAARSDHTILTTALEMRPIWGSDTAFAELDARISAIAQRHRRRFVSAKLEERDTRHRRQGDSRYLLEPHIKEGKGGLRDLQSLNWITLALYGDARPQTFVERAMLSADQVQQLEAAHNFLWDAREALQALDPRSADRLTFDQQPEVARVLGYAGSMTGSLSGPVAGSTTGDLRKSAETFMKAYYRVTKTTGSLTRTVIAALEADEIKPGLPNPLSRRRTTPEGYRIDKGRLTVTASQQFTRQPGQLLSFFAALHRLGLDAHPQALRLIGQSIHVLDESHRQDPAINADFVSLFSGERDPTLALSLMNDSGVLGAFIPDWAEIVGLMQFDRYHHYTVDEHTLFVIAHLYRMAQGQAEESLALGTALFAQVTTPQLLYLAALLHDIAKGRGGDHSELGAEVALRLGPRFGLDAEACELVAWLVRHHLALSHAAFRRDLEDPDTLDRFARLVGNETRLVLLTLLTMADIRAVGPTVWSEWNAKLVTALFTRTRARLKGQDAAVVHSARLESAYADYDQAVAALPLDWRRAHRDRLPERYLLDYDPQEQAQHARWLYETRDAPWPRVTLTYDANSDSIQLLVLTPDEAGLLARLAGALSLYGATIRRCRVHTLGDGLALDSFDFTAANSPLDNPQNAARFQKLLHDAVTRRLQPSLIEQRLAEVRVPSREQVFYRPPAVRFDNGGGPGRATILEVRFSDRPGQLFRIAHTLAVSAVQVHTLQTSRYGDRIVDTFYISDLVGQKVLLEPKQARIEAALLERLA